MYCYQKVEVLPDGLSRIKNRTGAEIYYHY